MAGDLNKLHIESADGPAVPLEDPRAVSADGRTSVFFRGIEDELTACIRRADAVR